MFKTFSRNIRNKINFNKGILNQEARRLNRRTRRWCLSILPPHFIKAAKMVKISQKYLRLDHIIKGGSGCLKGLG